MSQVMDISVIIATRNRAKSLTRTLDCFKDVTIPTGVRAEILVVDNASNDETPDVAEKAKLKKVEVRYLYEGRRGKSQALNAALPQARGQIVLFTDDDVLPAKDWLERMSRPLLARECDAAGGRTELAKEICRPWMTKSLKAGLAFFDGPGAGPLEFIGANMGVHRSVFERIPAFDAEIGPGALGLFEDTLFCWQMAEAGFRLRYVPEALAVHHPDPSRLLRRQCLSASRAFGIGKAYAMHHWRHEKVPFPRLRNCYFGLKLRLRRLLVSSPPLDAEGIPPWEISYVAEMEKNRHFLIESKRPRNYSKRGLRKLGK
jgi:glycosyltransferase involved in cell wall biosynthesis